MNFINKRVCFFLLLLLTITSTAYPQDSAAGSRNLDDVIRQVNARFSRHNEGDSVAKQSLALSKEDSLLRRALSEYNLFGLHHRQDALRWNLTSSIIIFWVVIFLVLAGIGFAGLQFYKALYVAKNPASDANLSLLTQMEASTKGIKISSSVLGLLILLTSLLFFYLYLVYVYPVNEIF